jgi:signal transduction histidine kinase
MSSSTKASAALAAAIIFLFLSSFAAYFAFVRLRTSQAWVQHTRDVQLSLHEFASTETRAARLRALYVESGDESLLERHAQAVIDVRNMLTSVHGLIADNVSQQVSYKRLVELADQRIALMNQAIELKKTGKSTLEAQAAISSQLVASGDAMDQVLQSMHEVEDKLLMERQARESRSFSIIAGVLATSLFLALVLFLIHHQLLTDQVKERLRAETAQRALSARLLTLQDAERRRFARELHDSVGQHLAALKMGMSMIQAKMPADRSLKDCLKLLDDSIAETRTISHLLHPPLLDEAGLNSAFRWFVEGFAARSGIDVKLDIREGSERLSDSIELVLFRVLQEGLTNVHRHSGAKRADVSLITSGARVILRVKDYGRGMSSDMLRNTEAEGVGSGVGLAGMKERLREIGGRLQINSSSDGTQLVADVPTRYRPPRQMTPSTVQEVQG